MSLNFWLFYDYSSDKWLRICPEEVHNTRTKRCLFLLIQFPPTYCWPYLFNVFLCMYKVILKSIEVSWDSRLVLWKKITSCRSFRNLAQQRSIWFFYKCFCVASVAHCKFQYPRGSMILYIIIWVFLKIFGGETLIIIFRCR